MVILDNEEVIKIKNLLYMQNSLLVSLIEVMDNNGLINKEKVVKSYNENLKEFMKKG